MNLSIFGQSGEQKSRVVSCGGKIFHVSTSEISAECFKTFGASDVSEVVAMREDKFVK